MSKPKAQVRKAKYVSQEYRDPTRDYLKEAETLMWTDENGRPISRVDLINYDTSDRTVFEPSNILSSPQSDYYDLSFLNNEKRKLKAQETILNNKAVVSSVLDFVPIAGDIKGGYEGILQPLQQGNYLTAGLGALTLAFPNFIKKPLKWAGKGAKKLYNWSKNKTDIVEKAMNLAGYKKLYHGTDNDFPLKQFKSSDTNFGLHMTNDPQVIKLFDKGYVKQAYVKTRNSRQVLDQHANDYTMFDEEWVFPYSLEGKYYPKRNSPQELYFESVYPELLRKNDMPGYDANYVININKRFLPNRPFNMQNINWPNMPRSAKLEYSEIKRKVNNGEIGMIEANDLTAKLLAKYNIPVLKYQNLYETGLNEGHYDYIITDANALKLNVPKFEVPNYIFLGLGTGVTGYGGYKLYENLTNNE